MIPSEPGHGYEILCYANILSNISLFGPPIYNEIHHTLLLYHSFHIRSFFIFKVHRISSKINTFPKNSPNLVNICPKMQIKSEF